MDYFKLYEDSIVDIEQVKIDPVNKKMATVDIDGEQVSIEGVDANTTLRDFLTKLSAVVAKSSNLSFLQGQIKLDKSLDSQLTSTLKSIFPQFPNTIEFKVVDGQLTPGMKPEDVPHIISKNESVKLKTYKPMVG